MLYLARVNTTAVATSFDVCVNLSNFPQLLHSRSHLRIAVVGDFTG